MWQTKYASAVPKNLGVGVNFRPCSEISLITVIKEILCINQRYLKKWADVADKICCRHT